MRIFLSIKFHADQRNRARIETIIATLAARGHTTTCIVRDLEDWGNRSFAPTELMRRTFAAIDASDYVLVDLAEKGVGVGIEAGYAYAHQIPILTLAPRGAEISETLRGISQHIIFDDQLTAVRLER